MAERTQRRICVITGTRGDYGPLFWLMREIEADPDLALQLVVTGTHLAPEFGKTVAVIEEDGFAIAKRIDIEIGDDSAAGVARSLGLAVIGLGAAIETLKPDIVVLQGDRYEILAAAGAATVACVPIAHIHGGEITEGAMDDTMRHAITKMAHLHFTAAEAYRRRVIQLGEAPDRVFNFGAPGLDNVDKLTLLDRGGLERELGVPSDRAFFLVTYHPATLEADDPGREAGEMLTALDRFKDHRVVLTGANADPGRNRIARLLADYVAAGEGRASLHASLGQFQYLSAMKFADAVVGNSSSGIIEAPALGVPTVNIGDRQKGRLCAPSVIECAGERDAIVAAIGHAIDPGFRHGLEGMTLPYGSGGASRKIKDHLKTADLSAIHHKPFHDMTLERAVS